MGRNNNDVSRRRSLRIVAKEDYSTDSFCASGRVLKWMLRDQNRFGGEGNHFPVAEAYSQYEHVTLNGYGESYDPQFFYVFIFTPELYNKAEMEMKAYDNQKKKPRY